MLTESTFSLAPPVLADVDELDQLYAHVFVHTYPNPSEGVTLEWCQRFVERRNAPEYLEDRCRDLEERLANPDHFLLLARAVGGSILGSIEGSSARDTGRQVLRLLHTDPSVHGRGVGSALMDSFLGWIEGRGLGQPVELEVAAYNARAINFYRRYGFILGPLQPTEGPIVTRRMVRPA